MRAPHEHPRITVDPVTNCWHGKGDMPPVKGHERLWAGERLVFGHILFFLVFNGPIPKGYVVHHECETPDCWNPDHLVAITSGMHTRLHHTDDELTSCPHGHAYPENRFKAADGRWRCKVCTSNYKAEAKRRAKKNRRWRCVTCGATGGSEQFPLVGPTTMRCVSCGAQGGHKVKRLVA